MRPGERFRPCVRTGACVGRRRVSHLAEGQLEELAAMLAGLELEGCRLKNGRSACTVVRVQLVPVVEHHGGETLPGLVGVGIRHGCSCFFLLGSFDFGCWCFWFWGWSADFFRRRYCVLLIFSELVLAGGATTHTILM